MAPSTPLGFGGIERRIEPRDFELGAYQLPIAIPDTFMPTNVAQVPVYMQGTYPTCGGHAGATFDGILQGGRALSPKYLWDEIKQFDGFAFSDGTDMASIFKSLSSTGDCAISLLPNDLGTTLQQYSKITNVTTAMISDGVHSRITNYAYTNNPTFAQIKQAIFQNKAVIALVDIGDGWWLPDWGHVTPLRLGNKVGHHFIILWGYDQTRIWFRSSWSNLWALNGDNYFLQDYVPHVLEIGTALILPYQFIFTLDMQFGDANNDVIQLQRRLGVIPDSGWFGPITKIAVQKYQAANGIPSTGYVGTITRTRLNTTA